MAKTHSRRAYDYLKAQLVSGQLPPGSRILYGPVGKELGISATPVREAIGLLVNEGFVDLVPQLGAVVRTLGRREIIELYEMREALEPYAAEKAAERMDDDCLEAVRQEFLAMQEIADHANTGQIESDDRSVIRRFEEHDLAFHRLILESCGNELMIRTIENSHVLSRIFATDRHQYDGEILQATCEDHEQILKALNGHDAVAARVAMREHIRKGLDVTLRLPIEKSDRRWK